MYVKISVVLLTKIPIYNKCFGGFCFVDVDPAIISRYLSAIEILSAQLVKQGGGSLESIKLRKIVLNFRKTSPSGYFVVIGLVKDNSLAVEDIFGKIINLLEKKYMDRDWNIMNKQLNKEIEELLAQEWVTSVHETRKSKRRCSKKDKCPLSLCADKPKTINS
ncbi:MAG: hypothetical protein ACFFBD_20840 [Candidatus Hodarchaeota archaeon]